MIWNDAAKNIFTLLGDKKRITWWWMKVQKFSLLKISSEISLFSMERWFFMLMFGSCECQWWIQLLVMKQGRILVWLQLILLYLYWWVVTVGETELYKTSFTGILCLFFFLPCEAFQFFSWVSSREIIFEIFTDFIISHLAANDGWWDFSTHHYESIVSSEIWSYHHLSNYSAISTTTSSTTQWGNNNT